jgi:predicted Zn-dependent protease
MNRLNVRRISLAAATVVLLLFAVSCATNPVTGQREFMLLSTSDELAQGQQMDPQILRAYGQYEDTKLAAYLSALVKRLGTVSHQPAIAYSVQVLDSAVVNAFAVPGGYVYLTRGILAYLNDEAELAGVTAHEVGHIAARHSAQQYSRAQAAQLGLGLGSLLSPTFKKYAGLAGAGVSILFLSFSRENEREADDLGVLYSSKAGYDAHRMAELFVTLERLNPGEGRDGLPAWFSTHPNPPDRIIAVRKAADAWQADNPRAPVATNRDQFLRRLEGLVFGEDPRHGYVASQTFFHPELRFQFPIPAGWAVDNTASQVLIYPKAQDAAMLLSVAPESTPAAAASAFITGTEATVLASADVKVNGLAARRVVCDVATEQGVVRVLGYFIQKTGLVYSFIGYAAQAQYDGYLSTFEQTLGRFSNLTELARINVKPERLTIRATPRQTSLRQALQNFGVQQDELESHAILNGMGLDDTVPANTLLKVVR